jgi:hypothetical protein
MRRADLGSWTERLCEGRLRRLPSRGAAEPGLSAAARARPQDQGARPNGARSVPRLRSAGTGRPFGQVAGARARAALDPGQPQRIRWARQELSEGRSGAGSGQVPNAAPVLWLEPRRNDQAGSDLMQRQSAKRQPRVTSFARLSGDPGRWQHDPQRQARRSCRGTERRGPSSVSQRNSVKYDLKFPDTRANWVPCGGGGAVASPGRVPAFGLGWEEE